MLPSVRWRVAMISCFSISCMVMPAGIAQVCAAPLSGQEGEIVLGQDRGRGR